MNTLSGYRKCQLNYNLRRDIEGHIIENSVLLNIRTDDVDECFTLYKSLKAKLNGDFNLSENEEKKEPEFKLKSLSEKIKICPDCGNELVLRTASKGSKAGKQFFGCSAWPQCNHIETMAK